jgi:hypothetical protein
MTDALIEQQRRQAAINGPSLALRRQRRAAMTGHRETFESRMPAVGHPGNSQSRALAELELRARQLDLLRIASG